MVDNEIPIITLIGSQEVNLTIGSNYNDAGAIANDNVDGNISNKIVIVNPVDTNTTGTYIITYDVNDSSHNQALQVIRTVNVIYGEYPQDQSFNSIPTNMETSMPNYLQSYEDTIFHSKVTKITDRKNQSGNNHTYPKHGSAWNNTMDIIRIGYRLYDATTFEEFAVTEGSDGHAYAQIGSPFHGNGDVRWSTENPNMLYVLSSNKKFISVIINADRTETSLGEEFIDLSAYEDVSIGHGEGNLDISNEYIVFAAKKNNDNKVYTLLYKIGDTNLTWEKELPHTSWNANSKESLYFDWITVDPVAEHILSSSDHKIYLYDMNLSNEIELSPEASHGDLGIDINGDPVYVQFIFLGELGIWSYNLRDLTTTKLLPKKYSGGHVSCRNYQRPGWCYLSTSEEGYREVIALKLDNGTGTVERFAQTHTSFTNHDMTQVNVSPDGKKILFASDWDDENSILDTYHVSYPWE